MSEEPTTPVVDEEAAVTETPVEVVEETPEVTEEVVEEPQAEGAEAPEEEDSEESVEPNPMPTETYLGAPRDGAGSSEITGADLGLPVSDEERGFVRPFRVSVRHIPSGKVFTLGSYVAEELAKDPSSITEFELAGLSKEPVPVREFVFHPDGTRVGS